MFSPPPQPEPIPAAIAALTAAARQTRVRGAGTDQATVEPVDFGEIASYVLTAVAANLGGVEELLAGRPGSWEADHVRQFVHSTAGDDDADLWRYRTDPVRLPFDAEDVFYDFGLGDLYDDERDAAAIATFAEGMTEEQAAAAQQLVDDVEALFVRDRAAYAEAYLTTARHYLTERGITCGVELVTTLSLANALQLPKDADKLWRTDAEGRFGYYNGHVYRDALVTEIPNTESEPIDYLVVVSPVRGTSEAADSADTYFGNLATGAITTTLPSDVPGV